MSSNKPDPKKAITLKPNQRRRAVSRRAVSRRGRKRRQPQVSSWQPHKGDQALDAWGVALRTLREQGVDV